MKKAVLILALIFCTANLAHAQQKWTLSVAAATCTTSNTSCLIYLIDPASGGATFTVGANASGNTLQFEATGDGGTTWVGLNVTPSNGTTAVTSTTSTGTWQANVAGYTAVRIRMSTLVSGTATVSIITSIASARAQPPLPATGTTAESFGASPSATASANATAIQSALNVTGLVTLSTCGTYSVGARLVIKSNTRFLLNPCVTLQRAAATNDFMIVSNQFAHSGIVTGPTYSSGLSSCTNGTQVATSVVASGGGIGATGLITVSGNVPTGAVAILNPGAFYNTAPTSWTVATCTGTGTFTGGTAGTSPSTAVTLTYTSGTTVSVAWTGHGFSANQYVALVGSTPTAFNGVFKITSITDANDFVVQLYRLPSASPTGSAFGLAADHDIYVDGATWDGNQANQSYSGQTTESFNMLLGIGYNLHALNINCINSFKYCLNMGDAVDSGTDNFGAPNTPSDIIKFDGPVYNVWARNTHGYTGDDGVTFEDNIGSGFLGYLWTIGDVMQSGIDGTNIVCYTAGTTIAKLYPFGTGYIGGMTFRNIGGNSVGPATAIGATATGGAVDDLTVDTVTATTPITFQGAAAAGASTYTVSMLRLRALSFQPPTTANTSGLVELDVAGTANAGTYGQIYIDGLNDNNTSTPASGALNLIQILCASVNKLAVTHSVINGHAGIRGILISVTGALGQVNVDGLQMPTGDQVADFQGASTAPNITVSNSTLGSTMSAVVVLRIASTASLINNQLSGTFSNGVFRTVGSVALTLNTSGNTGLPTSPIVVVSGTPLITTNFSTSLLDAGPTGFRDDFISSEANNAITTGFNFTGDSGNWVAVDIAAQFALSNTATPGTFANPGQLTFTTGATSGNGGVLYKSGPQQGALGSNAFWEMDFIVELPSTANVAVRFGAVISGQQAGDAPTGGIWCEFDTANTGNSSTGYTLRTVNASTSSYAGNTVVPTGGFDHIRIYSTVVGTIAMTVNGGAAVTLATNVPTAAVGVFIQCLTRTTAAKTLIVDAVAYQAPTGRT